MRNKPLKYLITTLLLMWLVGLYQGKFPQPIQDIINGYNGELTSESSSPIILSEKRTHHILYGDGKSGGHKHGVGTPCKSEFPASWTEGKIIETTKRIAANDNLQWKQQENGYYVSENMEGDVNVRVVLGPQRQRVITSYPTNVKRNPCPESAR